MGYAALKGMALEPAIGLEKVHILLEKYEKRYMILIAQKGCGP